MKTMKRFLTIILAICVMVCSIMSFSVNAGVINVERTGVPYEENELQPMMANQCSYVKFNDKMANTVAQYHGYAGAEAFKLDYGFTSNANMYRNTVTGEIVLITNTGAVINTGLYGGWN